MHNRKWIDAKSRPVFLLLSSISFKAVLPGSSRQEGRLIIFLAFDVQLLREIVHDVITCAGTGFAPLYCM